MTQILRQKAMKNKVNKCLNFLLHFIGYTVLSNLNRDQGQKAEWNGGGYVSVPSGSARIKDKISLREQTLIVPRSALLGKNNCLRTCKYANLCLAHSLM
jgi:hypothetical protein